MRYRLLICDDNDDDVYILMDALKTVGLAVDCVRARDGVQALKFLTSQADIDSHARFDLVIMDHRLPLESGLEVLQALRKAGNFPNCPVVILTSRVGKEREAMDALGVQTVLEKPLSLDGYLEVGETLAKLCRHANLE